MKHLLDVAGSHVIVGLNDRAFVGSLLTTTSGREEDDEADKNKCNYLVELVRPSTPSSSSNKEPGDRIGDKDAIEAAAAHAHAHSAQPEPRTGDDKNKERENTATHPSVQAVAIYCSPTNVNTNETSTKVVWCAVARHDKSLDVYQLPSPAAGADPLQERLTDPQQQPSSSSSRRDAAAAAVPLHPHTIHRTAKRVSSLCFAEVPAPPPTGASSTTLATVPSLTVVIAADLAGDAVAFSLEKQEKDRTDAATTEEDEEDEPVESLIAAPRHRLLLGHTASMLTAVLHVATKNNGSRLLTADRDEKIRVSRFPNTHVIKGFLLGHTAFVSALAVSSSSSNSSNHRCVSWGGDGTLRLWDYVTCQELAVASTTITSSSSTTEEKEEQDDDKNGGGGHDGKPVPSKVAMQGDRIATICDDSQKIYLWKIVEHAEEASKQVKIQLCGKYACPSQPLGIAFYGSNLLVVVMREPSFFGLFGISDDNDGDLKPISDHSFGTQLVQLAAHDDLRMPESILERDHRSGQLKMEKIIEQRGGATLRPWNNAGRKETAKQRQKRVRKRQRREPYDDDDDEPERTREGATHPPSVASRN